MIELMKTLRQWLRQSSRIHLRENGVGSQVDLVRLIDRFIDDKLTYPLEWDDFISWEHSDPYIEAMRDRIASLEPLFFSKSPNDRNEAVRQLIAERNLMAGRLGLGARADVE